MTRAWVQPAFPPRCSHGSWLSHAERAVFPAHSRIGAFWEKIKRMQEAEIGMKAGEAAESMVG